MYLRPSEIRFTQDSINNFFDKKSSHAYKRIGDTLDDLLRGVCEITDIPTITVVDRDGVWYTVDNRRLWVFRKLEELGRCTDIPLQQDYDIPSNKFTTRNSGRSITVRRDAGGSYWKSYRPNNNAGTTYQVTSYGTRSMPEPYESESNRSFRLLSTSSNYFDSRGFAFAQPSASRPSLTEYGFSSASRNSSAGFGLSSTSRPGLAEYGFSSASRHSSAGFGLSSASRLSTTGVGRPLDSSVFGRPSASTIYTRRTLSPPPTLPSVELLDPANVRYTKDTIKTPPCNVSLRSVSPILVYRAFDEHWVLDGNRRLWSYKRARQIQPNLKVPANVKDDEDEFLEKMRADRPWLTLLDIVQMDDTVTIE